MSMKTDGLTTDTKLLARWAKTHVKIYIFYFTDKTIKAPLNKYITITKKNIRKSTNKINIQSILMPFSSSKHLFLLKTKQNWVIFHINWWNNTTLYDTTNRHRFNTCKGMYMNWNSHQKMFLKIINWYL